MAETSIEWSDVVWNPVSGCTRVSAGCDRCYAVTMSHRLEHMGQAKYAGLTVLNGRGDRHFNGQVRTHADALTIPLSWKKPRRVFVNSMSDLFHKDVPFEFIDRVFAVMALCPQHTFQVLTKRPERMAEYFASFNTDWIDEAGDAAGTDVGHRLMAGAGCLLDGQWIHGAGKPHRWKIEDFIADCAGEFDGFDGEDPDREFQPVIWPLKNVWLGTSIEDQKSAHERIPHLLKCPAAVRFLSCEPLLGPLHIDEILVPFGDEEDEMAVICPLTGEWVPPEPSPVGGGVLHWVIVGGESGPGARPLNVQWIRSLVAQCKAAGVPVFVKQLGANVTSANDVGFEGDTPTSWPMDTDTTDLEQGWQGQLVRVRLKNAKGNDPAEWPKDLRVREMPTHCGAAGFESASSARSTVPK